MRQGEIAGLTWPQVDWQRNHKTLAMTARYTHPTDVGKRRAIAVLSGQASKLGQENVTIDFPMAQSIAG